VQRIFDREFCETFMTARRGELRFDQADYRKSDGMCCPAYRHKFVLRWNGEQLVTVSDRLVPVSMR